MAASPKDLLHTVGAEVQLASPLGIWARHCCEQIDQPNVNSAQARNLLLAATSQIQLSSPEGQWALRLSITIDGGTNGREPELNSRLDGLKSGQVGRGPFWDWERRASDYTFGGG